MRPVTKPPASSMESGPIATGHLFNAIGPYCSTCEMPLPGIAFVWRPGKAPEAAEHITAEEWPDALLLCRACAVASLTAASWFMSLEIAGLRPDRDLTFRLGDQSPFIYELRPVRRRLLDNETGRPKGKGRASPAVIVRACSPAARATLDGFALNTFYFDETENRVGVPEAYDQALLDRRLELRTEAWTIATQVVGLLAAADEPAARAAILATARRLAAAVGFWSVWATVLWDKTGDRGLAADVLMPGGARDLAEPALARREDREAAQPAASSHFAGTRADWLS
jgi:hypothetical protein